MHGVFVSGAQAPNSSKNRLRAPLARSVVESPGGTIDLRSKPGIGTTIEISLPTVPVV